jgi:hypothetical protein
MLTALVGPNGSGKSSFLCAIELFYSGSPKFGLEDFYAEDASQDIEIGITFTHLDADETERFAIYVENGDLTVVRALSLAEGKASAKYHGSTLQNPEFAVVRSAGGAREVRAKYNELRQSPAYPNLATAASRDDVLAALKQWEAAHPEQCVRQRDDGQFFGFTEVAQGYLGRYTRFIAIHAVRDAAEDAAEGRGSVISELMDLVVRSVLAGREEIAKLKEDIQKRYDEIVDPAKLEELSSLQSGLTETLQTYVPDTSVSLSWYKDGGIEIPLPKAAVRLVEDGYPSTVVRTGHGLQRAFILTMLQHLAVARVPALDGQQEGEGAEGEQAEELAREPRMPNLVLGIEEPELYQHPNRQRHLAKILLALATGAVKGVAQKTQIIYATHSPLFVGIDRFDQIRLFRKETGDAQKPKVTRIVRTRLDEVADALWHACGEHYPRFTGETLRPRLQTIMTPWMSEGFFADVVVLVEGEEDRAAILGVCASMKYDLEKYGVSVIPCMGKCNLDRPYAIFTRFGIRTYLIWDSDKDKQDAKPEVNRRLLRLLSQNEEDWPAAVTERFACFKHDLHTALRDEIEPNVFDQVLREVQSELAIAEKDQALKNPVVIQEVVARARVKKRSCGTIEKIVNNLLALSPRFQDT